MTTVTIHHAKISLSRLIAEALKGKGVVIAQGNKPMVRLVPVGSLRPRQPGALKGRLALTPAFFEPLPDEDLANWETETSGER